MQKILLPVLLIASYSQVVSASQLSGEWEISLGLGGAYSASEDVTIKRNNASDIQLRNVEFENKPFQAPLYYTIRAGRWFQNDRWADSTAFEMEFIHHKLYAVSGDLGKGVSKFEMTDGYNLLYLNYAVKKNLWIARAGIGATIPHPDVIIDGVRTHGDYQLAGLSGQLSLEREFVLNESFALGIESKVTYSYAEVDIDGGSVEVPNTAIHLTANLKYRL